MPFFHHDGFHFHFLDEGHGLPFFFQHGLGADTRQPFSLFRPPAGFRLICLDTRAHGKTHPAAQPDSLGFNIFADDLRALLDHLGFEQAIIGGLSMGAGIALNFALRHPNRLLGLVLSRPAWLDNASSVESRILVQRARI